MYGPLNLNKLMDKNCENIICDKIIMYEKLDDELDLVFNNLKIPFNSKLNIYKKSDRNSDYKKFYTKKSQKLVEEIFGKKLKCSVINFNMSDQANKYKLLNKNLDYKSMNLAELQKLPQHNGLLEFKLSNTSFFILNILNDDSSAVKYFWKG